MSTARVGMDPLGRRVAQAPRFADVSGGAARHTTRTRLQPILPDEAPADELSREAAVARAEIAFIEALRHEIAPLSRPFRTPPTILSPGSRQLKDTGPGQGDPLFPWLAEHATSSR